MALFGSFAQDQHLGELNTPLDLGNGIIMTPAQRRAAVIDAIFDGDADPGVSFPDDVNVAGTLTIEDGAVIEGGVTFEDGAVVEGDIEFPGVLTLSNIDTDDTAVSLIAAGLWTLKRVNKIVTVDTGGATTSTGITPSGQVFAAALRVSTAIAGLDSADHHIQLGVSGTADKYVDKANGSSATSIALNKKGHYAGAPVAETLELILTITGGSDQTPSSGAVEIDVLYAELADLADA